MKDNRVIEDAVPANAAGVGATIAGLDNNPPMKRKLMPFKLFVRQQLRKSNNADQHRKSFTV